MTRSAAPLRPNLAFRAITAPRGRTALACLTFLGVALIGVALIGLGLTGTVHAQNTTPVVLELVGGTRLVVPATQIAVEDTGVRISETATLESPIGNLELAQCDLFLGYAEGFAPEALVFDRANGSAQVPPPIAGGYVSVPSPVMAIVGFDFGENLDLGVPLQPDRKYLYFQFDAGLTLEFGATGDAKDSKPLSLDIPAGASATLILDPTDPFYFIDGALTLPTTKKKNRKDSNGDSKSGTDSKDAPSKDADSDRSTSETQENDGDEPNEDADEDSDDSGNSLGMGRSLLGTIPFRPRSNFGIETMHGFDGHRIETGKLPIGNLPLEIDGYVVTRLDPLDIENGVDPLGFGFGPSFAMGANGTLSFGVGFLGVAGSDLFAFGFDLGDATAAVEVFGDRQRAYVSGVLSPDLTWIPPFVPIVPRAELRASAYLGDDIENTHVQMEGELALDAAGFGDLSGLEIGEPLAVRGAMKIDRHGFFVEGVLTRELAFVDFQSEVAVAALVSPDPNQSYLLVSGLIGIGPQQAEGWIEFSTAGVRFGGALVQDDLRLELAGSFATQPDGVFALTGNATIPPELNEWIAGDIEALVDDIDAEVNEALDELDAAIADHEFELSLRGIKGALPGICDGAIRQLNAVPGRVKKRWPKKWGIVLPGRSAAVKSARKQVNRHIARLKKLRDVSRTDDPEAVRPALRSALKSVLDNRVVKIRVKRIGTVYKKNILSGDRAAKVRAAIAAVDRLPETSERRIAARRVVEELQPRQISDEALAELRENIPGVESIGFRQDLEGPNAGSWTFSAVVRIGSETRAIALTPSGSGSILRQLTEAIAAIP